MMSVLQRISTSITTDLIIEASCSIKVFEELHVFLASPEIQISDLEVGPEVAPVVSVAIIVREELHRVVLWEPVRVLLDEI